MRFTSVFVCLALTSCVSPYSAGKMSAADAFMERLSTYCGKAFAGRLVSNEAVDADMATAPMVMHIKSCSEREIRIPFHVGKRDGSWDRSRTWVFTRTAAGLRLKHDHRHEDGSQDNVTMYGGDTMSEGTVARQEFVVDGESIALFRREGLDRSVTNIWAVEISPIGKSEPVFAYELRRTGENARYFRVEFDLAKPAQTPPAPWGHSERL
jgi:hypothetical protein